MNEQPLQCNIQEDVKDLTYLHTEYEAYIDVDVTILVLMIHISDVWHTGMRWWYTR